VTRDGAGEGLPAPVVSEAMQPTRGQAEAAMEP